MKKKLTHIGIDFGGKLNGTTAICYQENRHLTFRQSTKKQDSSEMIKEFVHLHKPDFVFIDVPLSLPGIYRGLKGCSDYMYRQSDRELDAMSPMFLGGFTARGIELKDYLESLGIQVFETYPADIKKICGIAKDTPLEESYSLFSQYIKLPPAKTPANNHQLDALVCWTGGAAYLKNKHHFAGNPKEGLILTLSS